MLKYFLIYKVFCDFFLIDSEKAVKLKMAASHLLI